MNVIPEVKVGIMNKPAITFILCGQYMHNNTIISGQHNVCISGGKIILDDTLACDEISMIPVDLDNCSFTLLDVTIGINFHWERKENQRFKGKLKFIMEQGAITAVNILPVEDYLTSVISSEMSATSSLELLKAHAVISRSWLLAQINKHPADKRPTVDCDNMPDKDELIKWYDHEDHTNFDVCADDHCQRYQGITRESTESARLAVEATWGQVLTYNGNLCDARFSKCCGGVLEQFENCWEPIHHNYLKASRDAENENEFSDLTKEDEATRWIMSRPNSYCDTADNAILQQVLNKYDQETTDFYRWKVEYTQEQLSELIKERSGIDFGNIFDLQPLARGTSGRIYKLKIIGDKHVFTIGKELEIRRTLSRSHLYSSAFVVTKHDIINGIPQKFILHGAGWGHGVGLCQIGAAVMGEKGFSYTRILQHYFKEAEITSFYDNQTYALKHGKA